VRLRPTLSLLFLVAAAGPHGVSAADRIGRFTRLSVGEGLSQATVTAILQDHVGFLWLATDEGLNRYDGYTFAVFKHDPKDPQSLPDDLVSALHEDRLHRLWVGTEEGLSLFDPRTETFSRDPSIHGRVNVIAEDPDGTLWAGTQGDGVFERKRNSSAFYHLQEHNSQKPAHLASQIVFALLRDRNHRLWIGTSNDGIYRMEEGGERFLQHRHDPKAPASLSHDDVWGFAEDASGNLWVATYGGGLNVLDQKTGSFRHYRHRPGDPRSLATDLLTCLFLDHSGTLWVGTDGAGVQRYDPASDGFDAFLHDPADANSLSQNVVRSIYEDRKGQLWVGTYQGGVNVLKKPHDALGYFTNSASDPSSLGNSSVASFLEDAAGRIWVGTEQGWLNRFDRQSGAFVRYRFPSDVPGGSAIVSLVQDRQGRIWTGTYHGGVGRFDPANGTFVVYRHRPGDPSSLADDDVWALAEGGGGTLWLGTNSGLDRFDPDLGRVSEHYGMQVRALLVDRQRSLWVGSLQGLHHMLPGVGGFVHYRHADNDPHSLSNDAVVALDEDDHGGLWVGTLGGGVNRLDPATASFTSYRDFPSKAIFGVQHESSGRLWVSTNHGLSRLDPTTGQVDNFDLSNGLQSLQFHMGASLRTRSGRLLFGSTEGFYDFDPRAIAPDTFAPPVVITTVRVFNQPVRLPTVLSTSGELTLSHSDKIFSLEFAALDYTFPKRNRYAYMMEGLSEKWIQLGSRREVTFTSLSPGTYVFRVKASNSDGVWSDTSQTTVRVIMRPPWWGTWWFRALSAAMVVLALLTAHRVRVRRLTDDLAKQKRTELALRRAEEKYRSIFENAGEGIFQASPEGGFLTANPAMARILGYASPEELITDAARGDIPQPEPLRGLDVKRLLGERDSLQSVTTQVQRRDGRTIWLSVSARIVRDPSGAVLYYEGTAEDITERRRAEEAEAELRAALRRSETMAAMGMLVAGVAHEVRNPLFGISANLDVVEATIGSGKAVSEGVIAHIRMELGRLTNLMHGLLEYGKPQQPTLSPGPLGAVITEAVKLCADLAAERHVTLANHLGPELPAVPMDRQRLVQLFQNLLQNAIQHSPAGGTVRLDAAEPCGSGSEVVLTIKDSGSGFAPEDLPHVFEPFFSRRRGGTGLGLAIVQRIIDEHRGHIMAANRAEGGATMTVRLPSIGVR